jgi:hypothetical protein
MDALRASAHTTRFFTIPHHTVTPEEARSVKIAVLTPIRIMSAHNTLWKPKNFFQFTLLVHNNYRNLYEKGSFEHLYNA